jgi:hypothetical protein
MTIAKLPPSNHVQALRSFIQRMLRTRAASRQEAAKAEQSLDALASALKSTNNPATDN